jgi:hypothetical protein
VRAKFFDWNGNLLREMHIPRAPREYKLAGIVQPAFPGDVVKLDPERTFTLIMVDESREALYRESGVAGSMRHDLDSIVFELRRVQVKQEIKDTAKKQKEPKRIVVLARPKPLHTVQKPTGVVREKFTYWP